MVIARVVGDAYGYRGWVARRLQPTYVFLFLVVLQVFSEQSEAGSYGWYRSDFEKQDETQMDVSRKDFNLFIFFPLCVCVFAGVSLRTHGMQRASPMAHIVSYSLSGRDQHESTSFLLAVFL